MKKDCWWNESSKSGKDAASVKNSDYHLGKHDYSYGSFVVELIKIIIFAI